MRRILVLLCGLLVLPVVLPGAATADPLYCTVVRDGNGNPVDTVCVPWPGH